MTLAGPNDLLRRGLLEGVSLLVADASSPSSRSGGLTVPGDSGAGRAVAEVCTSLGAHVVQCDVDAVEEAVIDDAVAGAVGATGGIDLLVVDGAALFARGLARGGGGHAGVEGPVGADECTGADEPVGADERAGAEGHAGGDGHAALRACMDGSWNATRAVVNNAFLRAPEPCGRVVFVAPAPDAGEYAAAAAAGLENLARTLSIEWARYAITTVTIAPGPSTAADEVATLVGYLASPAGAYFSGCLLDLRGAAAAG